jgi:hypothetical protein
MLHSTAGQMAALVFLDKTFLAFTLKMFLKPCLKHPSVTRNVSEIDQNFTTAPIL